MNKVSRNRSSTSTANSMPSPEAQPDGHVSGLHAVEALLRDAPERVRMLLLLHNRRDGRMAALRTLAARQKVRVELADKGRLERLGGPAHQGAVASCHALPLCSERELEERLQSWPAPRLLLAADGIQDPRNLGACLRSAEAAGAQAVLLPKRRSAPLSTAALKAASGAAERIALVEVGNLVRRLQWLKRRGLWIIGAQAPKPGCEQPSNWSDLDLTRDIVLVVGGEGAGLRRLTRETCDELARIPMAGAAESLNVAVATGVLLFEAVRQRSVSNPTPSTNSTAVDRKTGELRTEK